MEKLKLEQTPKKVASQGLGGGCCFLAFVKPN